MKEWCDLYTFITNVRSMIHRIKKYVTSTIKLAHPVMRIFLSMKNADRRYIRYIDEKTMIGSGLCSSRIEFHIRNQAFIEYFNSSSPLHAREAAY